MQRPKFTHCKEKGQSLVELALSLTFLLILVGGIFDLGMMFYTYVALRDTTQEGAIYGSYNPTKITEIKNRITGSATYPIDATQITDIDISCDNGPCNDINYLKNSCQGKKMTVEVVYTHEFIMPLISSLIGRQTIPLKTTITSTIIESFETVAALRALNDECP